MDTNNRLSLSAIEAALERTALGLDKCQFPLEVFPGRLQRLILNLAKTRSFKMEYIAGAMMVVAATAIGNSRSVRFRDGWTLSPMFYMIFVGRPGLGKTPPLNFAFAPLDKIDRERALVYRAQLADYNRLLAAYQKSKSDGEAPVEPIPVRTVFSDFTQEAIIRAHVDNPRGICIKYDEIIGFFKTINRYNSSSLIEDFLTIYAGSQLICSRKGQAEAMVLPNPCVSFIGTTQTSMLPSFSRYNIIENGFLDRFLFVCPEDDTIPEWNDKSDSDSYDADGEWAAIVNRLLSLEPDPENGFGILILPSPEATKRFRDWHNENVRKQNAVKDDSEQNTRVAKWDYTVQRIALVLHLLYWACDEDDSRIISSDIIDKAIRLNDFFESCHRALRGVIESEVLPTRKESLLSLLPREFTTAEAIQTGIKLKIAVRTTKDYLSQYLADGKILKESHGKYVKNNQQ